MFVLNPVVSQLSVPDRDNLSWNNLLHLTQGQTFRLPQPCSIAGTYWQVVNASHFPPPLAYRGTSSW